MNIFKSRSLAFTLVVIVCLLFVLSSTAVFAKIEGVTSPGMGDNNQGPSNDNPSSDNPSTPSGLRVHVPNPNYDQIGKEPPKYTVNVPAEPAVSAPAPSAPAAPAKELPKTGADMLMFIFPGIALVGAGWALRRKNG